MLRQSLNAFTIANFERFILLEHEDMIRTRVMLFDSWSTTYAQLILFEKVC